jgi:flagellar basal body-associated protein FliL
MDEKKTKEAVASEKRKEPVAAPTEAAPRKNNTMLFVGVIFIAIVLQSLMLLFIMKSVMPAARGTAETGEAVSDSAAEHSGVSPTSMGETTAETPIEVLVNIDGTNGERFVKAAVVLEYVAREGEKKGGKEKKEGGEGGGGASPMGAAIAQRMPKYKSQLIDIISKMPLSEITTPQAKSKIRQELLSLVNSTIPQKLGEVTNVYFTQFIIQ